jgi:5-(carboxyamino)imidazole ribonucleotide mutase
MVGIIMGSQSDLPIMEQAANFLKSLDIPYELTVVSAHRTPERMFDYAKTAKERGLKLLLQEQEEQHIFREWWPAVRHFRS